MVERLRVEGIFVIFCGFLLVIMKCENCAYAPSCPDISTWKPGFICEDDFIPIIKTRFIDGIRKKTICCRPLSKCNEQFWCKPHSNIQVLMENSSLPTRTSCASGCTPRWKSFDISNSILNDGVRVGSFSPGISSFIGRTKINGELQIGRIQISHPTGLFYTFDGSVRFTNSSIEYLENLDFIWKNSSHGALVKDAVTVTAPKNLPFYIGRIQINGFSYVGTVVRVLGLMYYGDEIGIERTTDCYEVLTCHGDVEGLVTENINFESTTSSKDAILEIYGQNSINQLPTSSINHPNIQTDSSGSFSPESSNNFESSSQMSLIVDESITVDINNSSGYSYIPPSLPFSPLTPTELPQDNSSTNEHNSASIISTKPSNSLIEAATVDNPSTVVPFSSTTISSSHSSQNASTKPQNSQSSTSAPISIHLWTQIPPFSFSSISSGTIMPQISSSTAIATADNNNEVHNVNVDGQVALQQLTSSVGSEDSLGGNVGGNFESNMSGIDETPNGGNSSSNGSENEENSFQSVGNLGQFVVENEGDIEGLSNGINHIQTVSTEGSEDEFGLFNTQTTEHSGINLVSQNIQNPGDPNHQETKNPSEAPSTESILVTDPIFSQITRTTSTTRTSISPVTSENSANVVTTSTETNDMSSFGYIPSISTESNESATQNLMILVSNSNNQSESSSSIETSTNKEQFESQTQDFSTQNTETLTETPATTQKTTTKATLVTKTTKPYQYFTSSTNSSPKSTTEASELNQSLQNPTSTLVIKPISLETSHNLQESSPTSLFSTIYTTEEATTEDSIKESSTKVEELTNTTSRFTTASKYTKRSTTSRTRRTTTRRTSTVEQQNENNFSSGWLFTTSGITESVIKDQASVNQEDIGMDVSTEGVEVTEVKEVFECVPHWKQLPPKSSFLFDGIEITSQNTNILSYIGQININNTHILGKIDLNPQNLPTFSFYYNNSNQVSTSDSINYLSRAQLQSYSWKISSKGLAVKNAISINQTGNWPYYIGRTKSNGVMIIGKVLPSVGLVYADRYGNEKITKAYEVLTCEAMVDETVVCLKIE